MICMFISRALRAVSSTHKCSWVLLHADVNYFEISLARKSRMISGIEFEFSGLGSSPWCCWVFILSPNMRRIRYLPTGYFWLFFIPATPVPLLNHRLGMISPWSVPHCRYHRYYIQVQSHQWLNLAPLCAAAWTEFIPARNLVSVHHWHVRTVLEMRHKRSRWYIWLSDTNGWCVVNLLSFSI